MKINYLLLDLAVLYMNTGTFNMSASLAACYLCGWQWEILIKAELLPRKRRVPHCLCLCFMHWYQETNARSGSTLNLRLVQLNDGPDTNGFKREESFMWQAKKGKGKPTKPVVNIGLCSCFTGALSGGRATLAAHNPSSTLKTYIFHPICHRTAAENSPTPTMKSH